MENRTRRGSSGMFSARPRLTACSLMSRFCMLDAISAAAEERLLVAGKSTIRLCSGMEYLRGDMFADVGGVDIIFYLGCGC